MKFPKYLGEFSAGNGFAAGLSKSNALEIVDVPYLTSATGPGFTTYKKDAFTDVVTEPNAPKEPYLWTLTRRRGVGVVGGVVGHISLSCPETGAGVEFKSSVDARGAPVNKSKPKEKVVQLQPLVTNYSVRIGGGWMLAITGAMDGRSYWPALYTFDNVDKNFIPSLDAEIAAFQNTSFGQIKRTFTQLCALGWDKTVNGYSWCVSQPTEFETLHVDDFHVWHQEFVTHTESLYEGGECSGLPQTWSPVITSATDVSNHPVAYARQEYAVYVGNTKGGGYRSVVYDTDEQARVPVSPAHGGDAFCIGPGRMMMIVTQTGGGLVPNTFLQTDHAVTYDYVARPDDTCPINAFVGVGTAVGGEGFGGADNPSLYSDAAAQFTTNIQFTQQSFSPLPSFVAFSEDFGRTWARQSFLATFGTELAKLPTTEVTLNEAALFVGTGYWACYLGEGKSFVFLPGIDLTPYNLSTENLNAPAVGCFLLTGKTAVRLPWPGDTEGFVAARPSDTMVRSMPGTFGVGCYACMARGGELVITRDFGATWSFTAGAMPNASTVPVYTPVVPTTQIPYKKEHRSPLGKIVPENKGRLLLTTPGIALAPAPGAPKSKIHLHEVMTLVTDGYVGELFGGGKVTAPGKGDLWEGLDGTRTTATYSVYYGLPYLRDAPRPELGTEFTKPKKPT